MRQGGEEVLKRLLESTMDYLFTHDKEELQGFIEDFKEEASDEYANDVLKFEELINNVFLLQ